MERITSHLAEHDFKTLFVERLGWDITQGALEFEVDEQTFRFDIIAHKRGFQIIHCDADRYTIFNRRRLRTLQKQLLKVAHEHIVIYSCDDPRKQVWQWAVRLADGRRIRHREHPFFSSSPPAPLLSRLQRLRFTLGEEENITLVDALDRVRAALDSEPDLNLFVNKPWYAEQSDKLAIAMQSGDMIAFKEFVEFHIPLARWGAKKWKRYMLGLDIEDAEQIASIGLILAAERFNPSLGFQFSTYAYHWIRQACQRHGLNGARMIRVPIHVLRSRWRVRAGLQQAMQSGGMASAIEYLISMQCRSPNLIEHWQRSCLATNVRSLSDPLEPEYTEARNLPDQFDEPLGSYPRTEIKDHINDAIKNLPPDDQRLIRLRYGLDGFEHTLEEIGQIFGVTRERIRQRQVKCERALRKILDIDLLEPTTLRDRDQSATSYAGNNANQQAALRLLLSKITACPEGIGAIEIASQCDLSRSNRKAAIRILLDEDLIVQHGQGRQTVYRLAQPSLFDSQTQNGLSSNAH